MTIRKNAAGLRVSHVTQYDSGGTFGNADVVATAPATVLAIIVSSKAAGALWLLLFDASTVPANGVAPVMIPVAVAAGTTTSLSFVDVSGSGLSGLDFSSGVVWAASTSATTLALDTTSSFSLSMRFVQ